MIESTKYILFLGRVVQEKRVDLLLRAFSHIKSNIDCDLVIAGPIEDRTIIRNFKNDKRIHFSGAVFGKRKKELLANAYIFVLPSDLEGFSVSLLEAMTSHCLCLASDIAANREALLDTGVYFNAGDVISLENKLMTICNNYSEYVEYKAKAYERVKENFSWSVLAERLIAYYKEC
jgi:glycosyltransferase involved in cell wall biosynthesis